MTRTTQFNRTELNGEDKEKSKVIGMVWVVTITEKHFISCHKKVAIFNSRQSQITIVGDIFLIGTYDKNKNERKFVCTYNFPSAFNFHSQLTSVKKRGCDVMWRGSGSAGFCLSSTPLHSNPTLSIVISQTTSEFINDAVVINLHLFITHA